jgi:para-aminobenzoate synthetase component 1
MRHTFEVRSIAAENLKNILLHQSKKHRFFALLDSNNHIDTYSRYQWLAGIGARDILNPKQESFKALQDYTSQHNDWLFGHLGYDLKNEVENLNTTNPNKLGFAPMLFFVPDTVVICTKNKLLVESHTYTNEEQWLQTLPRVVASTQNTAPIYLEANTSCEKYLQQAEALKKHLQYGNIYEINYCIEFSTSSTDFNAIPVFEKLNQSARAPFAAFYKNEEQYLLCASPERYLQKLGDVLTSQPIKGTIRRAATLQEDDLLKKELLASEKERSENVMITDLVRNDLSRTAAKASVKVTELFGIYTFNTVHQMITTIQSQLAEKYHFTEALKTTFPMGSMTGAPKPKAMQLIEEHENFARNLYAGAVGYITPGGDFDFNVVIRSLFYNANTQYLSARVGSAITIHCDVEQEYEECLLKAENLFSCLR